MKRLIAVTLSIFALLLCDSASGQTKKRECTPPKPGESSIFSSMSSSDGSIWKCSAEGKWVEDKDGEKEAREYEAKAEKERSDLYWALRTRVLTTKEMDEVQKRGSSLVSPMCWSWCGADNRVEEEKIFNDALLQQFRLRIAAEKAEKADPKAEPAR